MQSVGASSDDIRQMISDIVLIIRRAVPGVLDADERQDVALAAIAASSVDEGVVRRFGD